MNGYSEAQLITNRASTFVFGSSDADRRAWAAEAATYYESEGALYEAADDKALSYALKATGGVVFVPDATALSPAAQRELVRVLREKEERAKFVLGLSQTPDAAWNKGLLRDDLHFYLGRARVDLSSAEVKQVLKKRRARAAKGR